MIDDDDDDDDDETFVEEHRWSWVGPIVESIVSWLVFLFLLLVEWLGG